MKVEITRDPKLSKIDHLFALVTEKPRKDDAYPDAVRNAISTSDFGGRAEETITVLGDSPRKITLIGIGKGDAITLRGVRQGLFTAAKIAKKHRNANIAVVAPFDDISPRVIADRSEEHTSELQSHSF